MFTEIRHGRRNHDGHAAADAMAEQREVGEAKRLSNGRKLQLGFFIDEGALSFDASTPAANA